VSPRQGTGMSAMGTPLLETFLERWQELKAFDLPDMRVWSVFIGRAQLC